MDHTFGKVLKAIRKQRKLTQKMLCEDICSQSVLSRIESDVEIPNVVVMQQLCDRLGVSIDQVLHSNSSKIKRNYKLFGKFADLFRQKNFEKLEKSLLETHVLESLYLEKEFQLYYYYLGSCAYYLYHQHEKALALLKQGLQYTSKVSHLNATDEEVQLISCIGKVYSEMGKYEEAEYYLKKSMELYYEIPQERAKVELTKIFYNYGCHLYNTGKLEEALPVIETGIHLARKKNSYYFLDNLFQLKSLVYQTSGQEKRALLFQQLAKKIAKIDQIN